MTAWIASRGMPGVEPIYHQGGLVGVFSKFALTAALSANDTIAVCTVPAFAVIEDVILAADELDTNVSPTIHYEVGDSGSATRFISATAQSASLALPPTHMNVATGLGYQYTANTQILITISTGPATGATTGNVYCWIVYSFEAITATADGSEEP